MEYFMLTVYSYFYPVIKMNFQIFPSVNKLKALE